MALTPTQLTLREMRRRGYHCEVVERWCSFTRTRRDLFGFVDVLCLGSDEVVAVQATSYANVPSRVRKIRDHENVGAVRDAGIGIIVLGWRKVKNRWTFREVDLS